MKSELIKFPLVVALAAASGCIQAGVSVLPETPAILIQPAQPLESSTLELDTAGESLDDREPAPPVDDVQSFEEPSSTTTLDLCEPIDDRWAYPTAEQKAKAKDVVKATCKAMGVGAQDCKFFYGIVDNRESSYRWWVRHKLAGDRAAALSSYMRRAHDYGWSVNWSSDGRKAEDLSKIEFTPFGDVGQNPYFLDASRWMFGLGLGGLNIAYHLAKFDSMAPPEILCDPVINTMIQVTIARIAVTRYGAKNFAEVQAVYAGRTVQDERGSMVPLSCTRGCPVNAPADEVSAARRGDANVLKRCENHGLDCYKAPKLGSAMNLEQMTAEERHAAADQIRGAPLPPFDPPPEPTAS